MEKYLQALPVENVTYDPSNNVRLELEDESIPELMRSIKDIGLIQPIAVIPIVGGKFRVICGNRRLYAHKKLNLSSIPAMVYDQNTSDLDVWRIHMAENLQRENLTAMEEGREYHQRRKSGSSYAEIAAQIGKPLSRVQLAAKLYAQVDPEFAGDVTFVENGKTSPGKISATLAGRISSMVANRGLTRGQAKQVYNLAKKAPGTVAANLQDIVAMALTGNSLEKEYSNRDKKTTFTVTFRLTGTEVKRVKKLTGQTNITRIARDVLTGRVQIKFKI